MNLMILLQISQVNNQINIIIGTPDLKSIKIKWGKNEKQEYLRHLKKLRLAHKVELKNEKMLSTNLIDTLFKKRLQNYTDLVNEELQ